MNHEWRAEGSFIFVKTADMNDSIWLCVRACVIRLLLYDVVCYKVLVKSCQQPMTTYRIVRVRLVEFLAVGEMLQSLNPPHRARL